MMERFHKVALPIGLTTGLVCVWSLSYQMLGLHLSFLLSLLSGALLLTLGGPWQLHGHHQPARRVPVVAGSLLYCLGFQTNLLGIASLGWTVVLYAWLETRVAEEKRDRLKCLLPLAWLATPWIQTDVSTASAIFRESTAWGAATVFSIFGMLQDVTPTCLVVAGTALSIVGECDGRLTLQTSLIIGAVASYSYFRQAKTYWMLLPFLAVFAWIANVLRIILLGFALALFGDTSIEASRLHEFCGHVIVLLLPLFILCFARRFSAMRRSGRTSKTERSNLGISASKRTVARDPSRASGLAFCLLVLGSVTIGAYQRSASARSNSPTFENALTLCKSLDLEQLDFSESDAQRLGAASALKVGLRVADVDYCVTIIDGTRNRYAVHDPSYCWTILGKDTISVSNGNALALNYVEDGREKEALYWFMNGRSRYCSIFYSILDSSINRISGGYLAQEPVLVVVETAGNEVNWYEFMDLFPLKDQI